MKVFLRLVEMMFGLVYASFSLPEWEALKMTFIAPWLLKKKEEMIDLRTVP